MRNSVISDIFEGIIEGVGIGVIIGCLLGCFLFVRKVDSLQSDLKHLTEKLDEAEQVLRKQDSIIRNFSPVITVQIPCEHARK